MAQITWRNVDAPDLTGVARLQQSGAQSLRDALAGALGIITQNQALSNQNFNVARERNTADLQNQLLGFTDPQALQDSAAQFSPDALRQQFGAAYDQGAINQTLATRPGQLRADLSGQIQLENQQKEQASQPYENQFYSLLASNPAQAEQFLRANEANFADSRQLYADLTNRRQQLEQAALQRAQLAESRAARQDARADRMDARTQRQNLNNYAKELNEWVLKNPDKPIGSKAAELQTKYDVNPVMGNQVTGAVQQNIQALGAPTPEQSVKINSAKAQLLTSVDQFKQDAIAEVNAAFAGAGISTNLIDASQDKKTTQDDVIDKWGKRLGDTGNAASYYDEAKRVLGDVSPAVIDKVLQDSYDNNYFFDGGSMNKVFSTKSSVKANAEKVKKALGDTSVRQAFQDALRTVDSQATTLLNQGTAPITNYARQLPAFNTGANPVAPSLVPIIPDYSGSRRALRQQLQSVLGDPNINRETVRK